MTGRYFTPSSPLSAPRTIPQPADESLIADTRAGLTPAQHVERKLISLLKSNPLPVSHVEQRHDAMRRGRT